MCRYEGGGGGSPQPGDGLRGERDEGAALSRVTSIVTPTVYQVLRHGYIMIRMDGYETDPSGGDWFCYHGSSPFIFPPGFCERNNIKLKPPGELQ